MKNWQSVSRMGNVFWKSDYQTPYTYGVDYELGDIGCK